MRLNAFGQDRDQVGRDLGYGDGYRCGLDMCCRMRPALAANQISSDRGDDFARGYFDAVWQEVEARGF